MASKYIELFNEHMPKEFLEFSMKALIDSYRAAYFEAKSLVQNPKIAAYMRPYMRRGLIESKLLAGVHNYKGVLSGELKDDKSGYWNHVLVDISNVACLTQSTARHKDYPVRCSEFRKQLTLGNIQGSLFPVDEFEEPYLVKPEEKLYAIILHGRDLQFAGRLGFATIRFPRPSLAGYYPDQIDLFQMFPALASMAANVKDDAIVSLEKEEDVGDLPDIDLNEHGDFG